MAVSVLSGSAFKIRERLFPFSCNANGEIFAILLDIEPPSQRHGLNGFSYLLMGNT